MNFEIDNLSDDEKRFIGAMLQLQSQGIDLVIVDYPNHSQILFPDGFNAKQYNHIVPRLVQKGFLISKYDAPRDGPQLSLSTAAKDYYAD